MKNYKEVIEKLFEAIDPNGQLGQVKDDMVASVEDAVQSASQDKEAQIKALETELATIKSQQGEKVSVPVQDPVEPAPEELAQQEELQKYIQEIEQQTQKASQKILAQEEQIKQLKQQAAQSVQIPKEQHEQMKQFVQEIEQQTKQAEEVVANQEKKIQELSDKLSQEQQKFRHSNRRLFKCWKSGWSAKIQHKRKTKKLQSSDSGTINAIDAKNAEDRRLSKKLSMITRAFLDDKAELNVKINATALPKRRKETFDKIRELLWKQPVWNGCSCQSREDMEEAKGKLHAQLNEAIAVSKKNLALEKENESLKLRFTLPKGQVLKPSIGEKLTESMSGKSWRDWQGIEQIKRSLKKMKKNVKNFFAVKPALHQEDWQGCFPAETLPQPVKRRNPLKARRFTAC